MEEKRSSSPTRPSEDGTLVDHSRHDKAQSKPDGTLDHEEAKKLENPLYGKSREELKHDVNAFADRNNLGEHREILFKGALIAQTKDFEAIDSHGLSDDELAALRNERDHRWSQSRTLYATAFLVSMAAVVQGMDETVINGANLFYPKQFGIGSKSQHDTILLGLVNSAPYLCSGVFSCWLTKPLNERFGRRGALFISTTCAFLGCIWNALTDTWWHLFISRLFLGLGIGPKSATAPILVAEVAPAVIRGALVMQWQMWTAFGIMLGTVSSLIFYHVPDRSGIVGLNWRLMLGSACLPAIIVMSQVFFVPESPRWLLKKGRHTEAWQSMLRLRQAPIIAARDLYYTAALIEVEAEAASKVKSPFLSIFRVPRNRRAFYASSIVMFGQQFCGVNAIAYYASNIFSNTGASDTQALLGSFGAGLLNWVFAIPAFYTIDTFGRRSLLLVTFPFLSLFMFIAGAGFYISDPKGQLAMVITGIYLYEVAYSPGMGPVPFSYSAEAYPIATATTWIFNFVVALTFPLLVVAFTSFGAFAWFGAWNIILWFLVLLFLPETKQLTLEELDRVFSVPTRKQAAYGLATPAYQFNKLLGRPAHRTPLYDHDQTEDKAEISQIEKRTGGEAV